MTEGLKRVRRAGEAGPRQGGRTALGVMSHTVERPRVVGGEGQLRFLFEATNIIPWEADVETRRFTHVGEHALRLLRYPEEHWYEPDFWASHIHPADMEAAVATCQKYSQALDRYEFEYRMIAADGQVVWIRDLVSVISEDGKPRKLRGFMIDITERRRTEEALRDLGGRLITAQEEERKRVARELHDDLSQRLALLSVELEQLCQESHGRGGGLRERLQDLWARAQDISVEMHRLSHQLHPSKLEYLGLTAAVESFCRELSERRGVRIEFYNLDVPRTLPDDVALCLYRIVQESLSNVVKHSGAQEAKVVLGASRHSVHLCVSDSGSGFDVNSAAPGKGLGLVSMRERLRLVGGVLTIHSAASCGTRLDIRIPLATATPDGASFPAAGSTGSGPRPPP